MKLEYLYIVGLFLTFLCRELVKICIFLVIEHEAFF